MKRDVALALGTLIDAALERLDVRRINSVFYDKKKRIALVVVENASPAYDNVALVIRAKAVTGLDDDERERWADKLLAKSLGDDGDDEDDEDEEEDEEEDDEEDDEEEEDEEAEED